MEPDLDQMILARVRLGDTNAFAELVEKYKLPITQFAARMLGDQIEAQDVAQNVFIQAYRGSGQFRNGCKVATWLHRIARNLCLNEIRRRKRQRLHWLNETELPAMACEGTCELTNDLAPESIALRELEDKLGLGLAALPERQRTALLLLQEQELSYEEISEVLGQSLSAVKSLIHRARQKLRRKLAPCIEA